MAAKLEPAQKERDNKKDTVVEVRFHDKISIELVQVNLAALTNMENLHLIF